MPCLSVHKAMEHFNVLGAGAKKRRNLPPDKKFEVVMKEWERGTLHSGSGAIVHNQNQALAIAFFEMRNAKKRGR